MVKVNSAGAAGMTLKGRAVTIMDVLVDLASVQSAGIERNAVAAEVMRREAEAGHTEADRFWKQNIRNAIKVNLPKIAAVTERGFILMADDTIEIGDLEAAKAVDPRSKQGSKGDDE